MNIRTMILVPALLLALALPAPAADQKPGEPGEKVQEFSFYGLHFRMTRDQVANILPTNDQATEALKPAHGMMFLSMVYDYRDRLMEIRASYPLTGNPLEDEGRRRALREKFIQPLSRYRNLSVSLDEYGNRAALTLVIVSQDVREEVINHYKSEALKLMD